MTHPGESPGPANPSSDRFVSLFTAAPFGIALTDGDGVIVETNPALTKMIGMDAAELRGMAFTELLTGSGDAEMVRALINDPENPPVVGKDRIVILEHPQEGPVHVEVTVATLPGDNPARRYPVIMVRDISDLQLLQERLHHQNLHDSVTGLPNAGSFMGKLEAAMADRTFPQLALLEFGLDGFRVVNDGLGTDVGDHLLLRVAMKLREVFGPEAVIARLTGDAFGVLLRGSFTGQPLIQLAEEALEELAEPAYYDGCGVSLSASVGIVVRSVGEGTAADLARAAEITVHRAKAAGRAQWMMFDSETDRRERHVARRAAMIGGALETGEFELAYDATIRPDGGDQIVAVQAEMGWNHPEDGPLPPSEFIPMADQTGMTMQIGRWALNEAVATVARWHAEFGSAAPGLSLRLPSRLAIDQDLVGMVRTALERHELPAKALCMSVKTSTVRDPRGEVVESLELLSQLGVQIGLLAKFTADFDMVTDELPLSHIVMDEPLAEMVALDYPVTASAAMRGLKDLLAEPLSRGIEVVAQGVKSREQMRRMAELGVSAVRGPFFRTPLSAEETHELLAAQLAGG